MQFLHSIKRLKFNQYYECGFAQDKYKICRYTVDIR